MREMKDIENMTIAAVTQLEPVLRQAFMLASALAPAVATCGQQAADHIKQRATRTTGITH